MLNINGGEIILLALLALIVFGPQRLPEIARQIGRAMAEVRRVGREFEREVRDVTDPITSEIRDAEREARKAYALDDDFSSFATPTKSPDADPPQA